MKTIISFFLLFTAVSAVAQQGSRTISGTVYDKQGNSILPGAVVRTTSGKILTQTDPGGHYRITIPDTTRQLTFLFIGFATRTVNLSKSNQLDVYLIASVNRLNEVAIVGYHSAKNSKPGSPNAASQVLIRGTASMSALQGKIAGIAVQQAYGYNMPAPYPQPSTESYKGIIDNSFQDAAGNPLSTFSVDVDAAAYSNVRRFINNGELPPADAVRIEEMINYFKYDLPSPTNGEPVAIRTELSAAPWNPQHRLLRIGLKARSMDTRNLPASNLIFLVDVSGSMDAPNKLPLVKAAMRLLTDQLRPQDKVAIVVYAGNAGLVLPATPGNQKTKILEAIEGMNAGGSTAGGEGIKLAYRIARQNFVAGGNNRVILSTDGDFNVGASSDEDMEHLIERERQSNVHLSVLGFGMGNYKDSKMETLADKGNGNYAYIDNMQEAKNKLVTEFGSTLFMVAKDVKLQVEFNPAKVSAYRLLGYENRLLNKEDFNNDVKDAGDMGAGHTVTAFYEIIPAGASDAFAPTVDPLKYQVMSQINPGYVMPSNELLTIKFRYKQPESMQSKLSQQVVYDAPLPLARTSTDFRFAAAVAEAGMLLRQSSYKQKATYGEAIRLAKQARGTDADGYRAEFIRLMESAQLLSKDDLLTNK